jgi:hypothetical protein
MAKVAVSRELFPVILGKIERLQWIVTSTA